MHTPEMKATLASLLWVPHVFSAAAGVLHRPQSWPLPPKPREGTQVILRCLLLFFLFPLALSLVSQSSFKGEPAVLLTSPGPWSYPFSLIGPIKTAGFCLPATASGPSADSLACSGLRKACQEEAAAYLSSLWNSPSGAPALTHAALRLSDSLEDMGFWTKFSGCLSSFSI